MRLDFARKLIVKITRIILFNKEFTSRDALKSWEIDSRADAFKLAATGPRSRSAKPLLAASRFELTLGANVCLPFKYNRRRDEAAFLGKTRARAILIF